MDELTMRERLLGFFQSNILYDEKIEDIDGDESLIDKGYIDSIGIITLVTFIKKAFDIDVPDNEIIPENFDSINSVFAYLNKKISEAEFDRLGGVS